MKKLIIAVGIIAAILAVLISFKAKSGIEVMGRTLNFDTVISIEIEDSDQI